MPALCTNSGVGEMAKGCNSYGKHSVRWSHWSYLVSQRITLQAANSSYRPYSTECVEKDQPPSLPPCPDDQVLRMHKIIGKILNPLWKFTNSGKSAIDPSCRCQFHHGSRLVTQGKETLYKCHTHIGIYSLDLKKSLVTGSFSTLPSSLFWE